MHNSIKKKDSQSMPVAISSIPKPNAFKLYPDVMNPKNFDSLKNLFIFLSFFSPIIVIFLFTFMGFYFSNYTGIVYLCFVLFSIIARYVLYKLLPFLKNNNDGNYKCNLVDYSNIGYGDIYLSLWVFAFTLFYTIYSAIINGQFKVLTALYIFYLIYFVTDLCTKIKYKCYFNDNNTASSFIHIILNILVGGGFGFASILLVRTIDTKLEFFQKQKSHETCKKTSDTMFVCDI